MELKDLNVDLLFEKNVDYNITPRVSIQMITYGHECFIVKAVSTLIEHEWENYELIISDDCSPDNTRQVLLTYLQSYTGKACVRYVRHRLNSRSGGDGHRAVFDCLQRGKLIMSMDGDDFSIPGRVKRTIDLWDSLSPKPSSMVVNAKVFIDAEQRQTEDLLLTGGIYDVPVGEKRFFQPTEDLDVRFPVSGSATVMSKEFYEWTSRLTPLKGLNIIAGDAVTARRAMFDKGIWFVNEPLFCYRSNQGSVTHSAGIQRWTQDRIIRWNIALEDLKILHSGQIPEKPRRQAEYWLNILKLQYKLNDCSNWVWGYWWIKLCCISRKSASNALKRRIKLILKGNADSDWK